MKLVTAIFYQSLLVTVILCPSIYSLSSTLLYTLISFLATFFHFQEPMKKPSFHAFFCLLFSLLLLFRFSASARLILPTQSNYEKEVKAIDVTNAPSTTELQYDLGLGESDECDKEYEECSERRMIAEAHLDYIYTQHHKPSYKHKP